MVSVRGFSVLSREQVIQALGFHIQGTPGDDALSGTALADPIQAFGRQMTLLWAAAE